MECGRQSLCPTDPLVACAHFVTYESARRVDRRRAPRAAVFGGNGSGTFLGGIRAGRNMAPQLKTFRRTLPMHKYVSFFRFGLFSMIAPMLTANPSAKAESYTLPGESSKPSAEEFIGTRGLVGIYYGHLPRDGHPRQKVTLVLLADPESGAPNGYVLERIGVAKMLTRGLLPREAGS